MVHPTDSLWSRIDGCPEACGNTEAPSNVIGRLAYYRCSDCGHRWVTSWSR